MPLHEAFNRTGLSRSINSAMGRGFRLTTGVAFLTTGILFRHHSLGIASLVWSVFPLSAGIFDLCWVSAALGGPIRSCDIRAGAKGLGPSLRPCEGVVDLVAAHMLGEPGVQVGDGIQQHLGAGLL